MKLSERLRKGLAIKEKIGRPYCAAVIVAAGTSSRMGGTNKILTVLETLPVICRTVDVFDKCAMIDEIIVVTQQELLEKVREEEKHLSEMEQKSVDMHLLLQGLREFTDMKELMPTIVNKLIRRIEVHNPEKKHARKSVKVDIYFTAVGLVSLPDEQEIRRMMEQMRSASQIPKQLTA